MAEIRVTGADGAPLEDDTLTRPTARAGEVEVVRTTPAAMTPRPGELTLDPNPTVAPPVEALDDPYEARAAIERTRSRMSETIDTIEEVLLRKKEQIQERLDVLAPVRHNPLPAAAAVFGAGLILGYLTGGDNEHELEYDGRDEGLAPAAAAERRWRSRHNSLRARHSELEDVVAQQRKELKRMRRELDHSRRALRASPGLGASYDRSTAYGGSFAYGDAAHGNAAASSYDAQDDEGGTMEALGDAVVSLKETVIGGIADLVSDAFARMRGGTENEQDRVINPT